MPLERLYANVNGNQGMHEHIRQMSAAIDQLRLDVKRLELEVVELRARLHKPDMKSA
jgi:hypothetical protein